MLETKLNNRFPLRFMLDVNTLLSAGVCQSSTEWLTGDQSVDISTWLPADRWSPAPRCCNAALPCSASERGVNLHGFTPFTSSPWQIYPPINSLTHTHTPIPITKDEATQTRISVLNQPHWYKNSHCVTFHPAGVTFPPLPQPIKNGTQFNDPGWIQGWVDLVLSWLHTQPKSHPHLTGFNTE